MVPTIYNADTLGVRPDLVGRPITQWKDLVDPAFKGKASILNISVDRHHGRGHGLPQPRRDRVQGHRQHDQGRDRQDHGR